MAEEPARPARPSDVERQEVTMRLLITTERLERLANRLEAFVNTPPTRKPHKA